MNIQQLRLWVHRMEDVEKATTIGFEYDEYGQAAKLVAQDEHGIVVETLELD